MSRTVISVENVSKLYRLGTIGSRTLRDDFARTWARMRNKPDPLARVDAGAAARSDASDGDLLWALRDVSFEVKQGEVLGIIGRNGAGKSTLLKILSRVTAPTSGEIKVKGRIASLLEVGTGFHPELTGRENIFLNGAILGMRRAEIQKKFDEIVAFSEVEKFIDTPVKRYSSGMYVRLAFAVAAHLEPEILIVDEVLAVGDAAFQKKCLGKMGDVAHEGRTVLFVSHNMAALSAICQSALVLQTGEITYKGEIREAIEYYLGRMTSRQNLTVYEARADADIQFRSVSVMDLDGKIGDVFSVAQPIKIQIEYDVPRLIERTQIVCHLWNIHRVHVLATADIDGQPDLLINRMPGHYQAEIVIPSLLLGPGIYQVTVACGVPNLRLIDDREGPSFEISAMHSYAASWSGARQDVLVSLPLNWRITQSDADKGELQ